MPPNSLPSLRASLNVISPVHQSMFDWYIVHPAKQAPFFWDTLPETNIAPKNGWLEYYFPIIAYWGGLFSGAMLVSGRINLPGTKKKHESSAGAGLSFLSFLGRMCLKKLHGWTVG